MGLAESKKAMGLGVNAESRIESLQDAGAGLPGFRRQDHAAWRIDGHWEFDYA